MIQNKYKRNLSLWVKTGQGEYIVSGDTIGLTQTFDLSDNNNELFIPNFSGIYNIDISDGYGRFKGLGEQNAHYIRVNDTSKFNYGPNEDFSMMCWINRLGVNDIYTTYTGIFSKGTGSETDAGFAIRTYNTDGVRFVLCEGIKRINFDIPNLLKLTNNWVHMAISVDRDGLLSIYFDGELYNTYTQHQSIANDDLSNNIRYLSIGTWLTKQDFNGYIDEAIMFDEAVSQEKVEFWYEYGLRSGKFSVKKYFDWYTNIVAYYRFEDDVTDTINNYDLHPLAAVSYISGKKDKAVQANTTNGIYNNDHFLNTSKCSISFWFKLPFGFYLSDSPTFYIGVNEIDNKLYYSSYSVGSGLITDQISLTEFNHIVITKDADSLKFYINGTLYVTENNSYSSSSNVFFEFRGINDEAAFWNDRILTNEEVLLLWNEGKGIFYP